MKAFTRSRLDDTYTFAEAQERLGLRSRTSIDDLVRKGRLIPMRRRGRLYFKGEEVRALARERTGAGSTLLRAEFEDLGKRLREVEAEIGVLLSLPIYGGVPPRPQTRADWLRLHADALKAAAEDVQTWSVATVRSRLALLVRVDAGAIDAVCDCTGNGDAWEVFSRLLEVVTARAHDLALQDPNQASLRDAADACAHAYRRQLAVYLFGRGLDEADVAAAVDRVVGGRA